jgi:hypothetical protein
MDIFSPIPLSRGTGATLVRRRCLCKEATQ